MTNAGKPIRVAQVMGKMLGGGVESVVMNYYRHIDRSQVQFDFLVDADSTLVPREEIESLGGRVFEIPPYQHVFEYQRALADLFRREKWQVVHSHINALSVFPLRAAKKAGVPVRIAHSHSTSGKGEHLKNAVKALLKTQANRYPTHRFACSEFAGRWLFGGKADFEVIYNAIDLTRFAFDAKVREQTRADLGLVGDTFVVGHVGRFMTQKNHPFLLETFEKLVELRPSSVLLLAGDGEQRPLAESWVAERGLQDKVMFLGQRSDVNRLYQVFDAFALPSLYEGLCLVGVEAQAAGLPCLLADTITREVDVTGTCEFLPIDDPEVWAEALARVGCGNRQEANAEDFESYDVISQSKHLADYYVSLINRMAE